MNSEANSRADSDVEMELFCLGVKSLCSFDSPQNQLSSAASEKSIHPKSGVEEKPSKDHEAFVVARQLLNVAIGSFQKGNKTILETPPQDAFYPIGRDPPVPEVNHYQMAADLLQFFLYDRKMCANSVRAINAAFAVLERLIRELTYTKSASQNMQYAFHNATQFRMLVNFWKNAALAEEKVLPAIEMIKKIQWMTSELPSDSNKIILFDKHVLNMIFQVLMKQVPKHLAPAVAEKLMEFVYFTIEQTNNADLEPDIFIYGQLMNAWINSGQPETPLKLDEILNDIRRHDVPLNTVTYGILIRYWAGKGSLTRITFLFEQMIAEGLEPDISCLGQALYGYTRAMQPLPAIEILEKMYGKLKFQKFKESAQDRATITASTLNILDSFKRLIIRGNDPATNITRAEEVVRKYESSNLTRSRSDGTFLYCLRVKFAFTMETHKSVC
jgi:pentatricopeptide repeat protein